MGRPQTLSKAFVQLPAGAMAVYAPGGWPTHSRFLRMSGVRCCLHHCKKFAACPRHPVIRHRRSREAAIRCPHAHATQAILQSQASALHHLQLLPSPAAPGLSYRPRSLPYDTRGNPSTVSFCRRRIRCHARAHPLTDQRTGGRRPFDEMRGQTERSPNAMRYF